MIAWFPHLRADGWVASGNAGIWLAPDADPLRAVQLTQVGIGANWAGYTLLYNRNDGTGTQFGGATLAAAYNDYAGSNSIDWAGANPGVTRYHGIKVVESVPDGARPQFYGMSFGYLRPKPGGSDTQWRLYVDGQQRAEGEIVTWCADKNGSGYVYVTGAPGKRQLFDQHNNNITLRADETPIVCFQGPDAYGTMMLSGIGEQVFARGIYAATGWLLPVTGNFYNPDARMIGDRLWAVGSTSTGQPQFLKFVLDPAKRMDVRDL